MKPGIYKNIAYEEYRAIDACNYSTLKVLIDKSAAHCKYYMDNGRPDSAAMAFGRALDSYLLEKGLFYSKYCVIPAIDRRTKDGKKLYAELAEKNKGKEILSEDDMSAIVQIGQAFETCRAKIMLTGGDSQSTLVWTDEKTGLLCKARIDYLIEESDVIVDLKSTSNAKPEAFNKDMFKYGYYIQAGLYTMGYKVLTGKDAMFGIVAIETEPPYVVSGFEVGDRTMLAGKNAARQALDRFAQCKEHNDWPGYTTGIELIELPVWALEKHGVHDYNLEI